MSRTHRGGKDRPTSIAAARPTITACRGCCCGTRAKHPDVDHPDQLQQLRELSGIAALVRTSDCLSVCERSNVVVIGPSLVGRLAGARPVWLGDVLDDHAIADIATWVRDGGPGVADLPGILDLYMFAPSRRVRRDAAEAGQ